ncbi:hypothetical protein SAMN02745121_02768 [Nannocystis exedens]|uniref:Uncharacterized protein n=1 Tax=Nannocystis exedens TaxID=54 RepID=A0A1I1X771_9BACT|nr:hypothetical protein [Nannocystis exedens]PCC70766.1 hypothetical protein NAEX_03830 [Nannocystis exedens]SFE03265.1 hypothetical protein SAMN02745121_02768 [Nannocystis exedens]
MPLVLRPARIDEYEDDDELELELSVGLYTPSGPAFSPSIVLSELWLMDKRPANTLSMRGALTYERVRFLGEPQIFTPPQNGNFTAIPEKAPLERVTIEIDDNCHGILRTVTQEDSSWHIYVPDEDGCLLFGPHLMRPVAATDFGVYRVAAQRVADLATPPYVDNDFVTQKSYWTLHADAWPYEDHDWGERYIDRDDPNDPNDTYDLYYPWFASMQVAVRVQEFAKPFLVGDANTGVFPWVYLRVIPGQACGTTSCYVGASQAVYVSDSASNHDSQDEHALAHEMFHWFHHMFLAAFHGNGNCDTVPWSGAFGEGFANVMAPFVTGQPWIFTGYDNSIETEDPDFQGKVEFATGLNENVAGLPYDLYNTRSDCGSGGWTWRIFWDFLDGAEAEPWGEFADFLDADDTLPVNPTITDYGTNFDTFGGLFKFQDVLVRYLGGNYMPTNPLRPDLIDRGQDGVDMTEFLDGVICRGHENWNDISDIVLEMMNFGEYDPASAPAICQ